MYGARYIRLACQTLKFYFSSCHNLIEFLQVVIARGFHLFPFRTEKLSLVTPMVLRNSGRVGSRRFLRSPLIHFESRGFLFSGRSCSRSERLLPWKITQLYPHFIPFFHFSYNKMILYYSNEKANIVNLNYFPVFWFINGTLVCLYFLFYYSFLFSPLYYIVFHNSIILFLISHTYADSVMKPLIQYQRMQSRSQLNFLLISNILYCFFSDKVIS